ncbi:SMI1/KNR4 family protein [Roseateles sp. 22389]|uniref:SMI1/KNR4 family protein n=1 Tax=Roseateles sp. 22389 TaxID=3453916 RepID=UPI003F86E53D
MRIRIKDQGPKLSGQDVDSAEHDFGISFPESYRRFLLEHNGCRPDPDTIDIPGHPQSPTDVQVFFGIGRDVATDCLEWNKELVELRCPIPDLLPIACDSGGNLFCLNLESGNEPKVIYCDLDRPICDIYEVAASFDEFTSKIRMFEH